MKRFLLQVLGLAGIVYFILPYFVDGISVNGGFVAIITAVIFAVINIAIKPILKIVTLPLNVLSFGLFGLLINIVLFWLVAEMISGFNVMTITAAFWGALVMTIANWILGKMIK